MDRLDVEKFAVIYTEDPENPYIFDDELKALQMLGDADGRIAKVRITEKV